jgi:hypothetical protein
MVELLTITVNPIEVISEIKCNVLTFIARNNSTNVKGRAKLKSGVVLRIYIELLIKKKFKQ